MVQPWQRVSSPPRWRAEAESEIEASAEMLSRVLKLFALVEDDADAGDGFG